MKKTTVKTEGRENHMRKIDKLRPDHLSKAGYVTDDLLFSVRSVRVGCLIVKDKARHVNKLKSLNRAQKAQIRSDFSSLETAIHNLECKLLSVREELRLRVKGVRTLRGL